MISLVVIGAGGFGRETLDVVEAINQASGQSIYRVRGVVDDHPLPVNVERLEHRGYQWLGTLDQWLSGGGSDEYVVGVGSPQARRAIVDQIATRFVPAAGLVHPQAVIGSQAVIGPGSVVCAGTMVSTNVHLGRHVHLNPAVTIGHDTILADFVSINPGGIVSGEVLIETGVLVGAGAVILQGLIVQEQSTVGASACVVKDVEPGRIVKGVPAR
ncbi:MAG: NeuD/PglB/VioB family sugar acetyltransferase [Propionibacteriaceae bacterium]|nr:NeuD/PglB/VioB family sugar acetyltransferase [Propionibacteriaceae bacterium]